MHSEYKARTALERPNAIMLSMQEAYWQKLSNIANNLSNATNYGFKARNLKLAHVVQHNSLGNKVNYVAPSDLVRNVNNGSFHQTSNPLDLCLNGSGYFMVETDKGKFLIRNGQFAKDVEGNIVTASNNFKVLDQGGSPITIPKDSKSISISSNGSIMVDGNSVGKVGVFKVKNEQTLKNIGDNLLQSPDELENADQYQIIQGGLEESNVSPMEESIRLIEVMRLYENAQKVIEKYERARQNTMNVSIRGA
jgi:flagellar basal-body rod protein FlgF